MALTPQQLRAADFVTRLRLAAVKVRVPLSQWIDPRKTGDHYRIRILDSVLDGMIYDPPIVRGYLITARREHYWNHLTVILPAIANAARAWALASLNAQQDTVGRLQVVIAADAPNLARICKEAREKAQKETLPETTSEEMKGITGEKKGEGPNTLSRLERAKYRNAVRQSGNKYLLRLMAHPKGVDVIDAFAESAEKGKAVAGGLLRECESAIRDTSLSLRTDAFLIWNFPPAILAGVQSLGAPNVKALTDFALAWASIEKRRADGILDVAGNAILALQLVGGPIGGVIGEVLDTALAVVEGALTFVEEVDQQQAAVASTFASPAEKLATGGSPYRALAGAAALIVASAAPAVISRLKSRGRRAAADAVDVPQSAPKADPVPADPGMTSSRGKAAEPVTAAERKAVRPPSGAPDPDAPASSATRGTVPESRALPDDARVTPQARETTPAQKAKSELGDVSSGSTAPKAQRGTRAATASDADSVPPRTLRQGFRDQIEEKLAAKQREFAAEMRALSTLTQERAAINRRAKEALKKKDTSELRILQARQAELDETISSIRKPEEWFELDELRRQLLGTEQDYFESLSSAAASRAEYRAVLQGGVDEVFGLSGPLNVEHVFPRSRMFQIPGFERLSREEQIALFNYRPNLRSMNAEANRVRGARRYGDVGGQLRARFPRQLQEMAIVEAEMDMVMTQMITNGPYRREQFARDLRGELPLLPSGRPITVFPPAPAGGVAAKPATAAAVKPPAAAADKPASPKKKFSLSKKTEPPDPNAPPFEFQPVAPVEGPFDSTPGPGAFMKRPVRQP